MRYVSGHLFDLTGRDHDDWLGGTMRNATCRAHVLRPGRPCMSCIRKLDLGRVALDIHGLLDDPTYIATADSQQETGRNVDTLSVGVTAALLAH